MSQEGKIEQVLSKAEALEKKYDWVKAIDVYEQALRVVGKEDFLRKGEIQEKIGHSLHRAAFQAEREEEFKERMRRAIEVYKKAQAFYERLTDEQKARMLRCRAVAKYLGYWLTSDPSEKRRLLDECLKLEGEALAVFSESDDMLEYGRTYNELSLVFFFRVLLEWDRQILKSVLERVRGWGEKAVAALSELGNIYELARTYFTLADCLKLLENFVTEPREMDKHRLKVVKYLNKAADLSEKVGDTYLLGLAHLWLGRKTGGEESVRHYEKTLEYAKQTRDNFLIATGLERLANMTYWEAVTTEDPEKRRELAEKAMQFHEKAQHHYSIMSFMSPRGEPAGHAEHYLYLAMWETDPEKRLELLEKSEKAGMETLKLAENSGVPQVVYIMLHVVSKILATRAYIESDPAEKRSRLERALKYREKSIEILAQTCTLHCYWHRGDMENSLAEIKAKLADIEPDLDSKKRLLEEAVLSEEKCLKLCNIMKKYYERIGYIEYLAALPSYQDTYATLLTDLYDLTNKPEHLRKAIEISQKAIESARKLDMRARMAESYWKIARARDIRGEYLEAAENFGYASDCYMKAAEKIPQLKEFYQDHASYMQAWSEIEKARNHHAERQYGLAKGHYENAAKLHKSTHRWSYLSSNYLACARLEEAEDLSRREQTEEARDLFQQAANLFLEAKKSIRAGLEKIESRDEKGILVNVAKASDIRRAYCLGRIALEDAKILDRQGDHTASSKKYASATETFQKIMKGGSKQSRRELQPIIYLCCAWQKMMMAEAKASSTMYGEAAELFKQAKEQTLDRPTSLLTLAHSNFCKALEAGTEFEITRDAASYSTAIKHMEVAENYYLKAGFKNASEYAKATLRLFDAYMYMHEAQKETNLGKKAQYYRMAEKLLQASAGAYMKAKHPEKSEEVQRLLESVKEKRQLVISLTEVLHVPTIASATTSFSTPTPTQEHAVGLERFEHADIQANLIVRVTEVKVGEDVNLEIELVNAGKAPALLIKVDEIIPEGFEINEVPETYTVEDGCINMKGKRLNPLKTEDVKMIVKPRSKGTFKMKPRVLYIDETGKYRSHEPEPVTITVKELGIKGWIKG